jgi:tetratricopeptide (TPR) repeat protein
LKQPLLIIANYFFDSIPQQLIYVDESKIYECRVSYELPTETDALSASDMLEQMVPEYHYFRAAEYEQPLYPYRDVIELYQQRLEDSHILFPVIGLSCLERLEQLSTVGFLLLTADKGDHRLENWEFAEPPKLIHHGSFSLTANYHAIQHTFESKGALSYFTKHHYKNLNVGCILMLQNPSSYAHTRLAYRRFVERFGPDDFFSLKLWFDEHLGMLNFTQIISFWRLSQYDSQLFLQCVDRLLQLLPDASEEEANDLDYGISMMWSSYYPMNEPHHLAQSCANLLFQLELYESARHYFEQSLKTYEANGELLYDLAICCYEMEDEAAALDYAQQALATEPGHEEAKALIASIV